MSTDAPPRSGGRRSVVAFELVGAKRFWRSVTIVGLVTPLCYVLALGVGLGTLVNRNGGHALGVPYLVFVAPAFLTAAALQIGASESTYPVMAGFKWLRTYHGIAATPVTPAQLAEGRLLWVALRLLANSVVYLAIMSAFGAAQRWQVVLAVPVAVLTGLAFAAPVTALSASVSNEGQTFNILARFVITPMFLFSGTFYPISRLPEWGRWLAVVTPLWHGTELARDAAIGGLSAPAVLAHVGYLLAWLVIGTALARWRFRVRIEGSTQ